jgi:hypothetical protein
LSIYVKRVGQWQQQQQQALMALTAAAALKGSWG